MVIGEGVPDGLIRFRLHQNCAPTLPDRCLCDRIGTPTDDPDVWLVGRRGEVDRPAGPTDCEHPVNAGSWLAVAVVARSKNQLFD